VATTDMAQLILVMIFLPIVAFLLLPDLNAVGVGMGDLFREPFFGEGKNLGTFLYTSAPTIIGSMYSYEYFMRFQAAKSPAQAKKASLTAGIILLSTAVPIGIIGACANRVFPEVAANEVLATIITMKLPRWAAYLFMAAIFAALMSTADSVLTSLSAIVSRDIYGKLIMHGKNVPEKRTILIARLTIAAGAAFAAWAAMHFTQILKMSFYFSPLTTGVMFAPMILGLFWKKASRRGAMAAILCGGITGLCHIFGLFLLFDRVLGVMLVGSAALVLFSLLFPDESPEQKLLRNRSVLG